MRYVARLDSIHQCPNCGSFTLYNVITPDNRGDHKYCPCCNEQIFESEPSVKTESVESSVVKEKFIMDMREEIDELKYQARTIEEAALIEKIRGIFSRLVDYIEEH